MSKKNKVKRREAVEEILERLSERMYPDKFGDFVVTLASTQSDGDGVLHTLLYSGENYPVRALVDAGADINSTGNLGYTPLHVAAWRGNLEMTEFLLSLPMPTKTAGATVAKPLQMLRQKWGFRTARGFCDNPETKFPRINRGMI